MIKIAILGAAGRMGLALLRCASQLKELKVVAAVEAENSPFLHKDAGTQSCGRELGVPFTSDARAAAQLADVLIDFSAAASAVPHVRAAADFKKAFVLGTTGISDKDTIEIQQTSTRIPVVWAPNMSVGVNLLFALTARAARQLADYDIEIFETHHRHKKDAPSGTALCLAETAAAARGLDPRKAIVHGRHGLTGERPGEQIGVHSARAGDVVGDHTVVFAGAAERLELTHRASSRDCLAQGALRAAVWVFGQTPGLYSMRNVLGLKD